MKGIPIFWALKNGDLVHISEVESGLNCNCICPSCKKKLEAHKGIVPLKVHHFKHHEFCNCISGHETSIHLAAKKLISEKKEVLLPNLYNLLPEFGYKKLQSQKKYKVNKVIEEYRIDNFQPDIYLEIPVKNKNNKNIINIIPLFVEIAVTHFIDDDKKKKIQEKGISTIEINLRKVSQISNNEMLWAELTNPQNIQWIFHSKLKRLSEEKEQELIQKKKEDEIKLLKKNAEKERELIENDLEQTELWNQGFKLLKTYDINKVFIGYTTDIYDLTEGSVYCPQMNNEKIKLGICDKCIFYHGDIFDRRNYCTRVICGFNSGIKR